MVKPEFTIGISKGAKEIRQEVFQKEQGYINEFDEDDSLCICLTLYLDEYPVATGRLKKIDPGTYQIQRVAVRKAYRGLKLGTYVVKFLCTKARTMGARDVILHAQYDKRGFYKKLGFKEVDGTIDYDEGNPHIMMFKTLEKKKRR